MGPNKKKFWKKIETTQNSMRRSILNYRIKDNITITKIKRSLSTIFSMKKKVRKKWELAGFISRKKEKSWAKKLLFGN